MHTKIIKYLSIVVIGLVAVFAIRYFIFNPKTGDVTLTPSSVAVTEKKCDTIVTIAELNTIFGFTNPVQNYDKAPCAWFTRHFENSVIKDNNNILSLEMIFQKQADSKVKENSILESSTKAVIGVAHAYLREQYATGVPGSAYVLIMFRGDYVYTFTTAIAEGEQGSSYSGGYGTTYATKLTPELTMLAKLIDSKN